MEKAVGDKFPISAKKIEPVIKKVSTVTLVSKKKKKCCNPLCHSVLKLIEKDKGIMNYFEEHVTLSVRASRRIFVCPRLTLSGSFTLLWL